MPAGPVQHHDNAVIRVPCRHLIEEQLHTITIDVRQKEGVQFAIGGGHGRVGIGVFLRDHRLDHGAGRLGTPTAARAGDASEARFVLKHQPDRLFARPVPVDFREGVLEFFFHSS